MCHCMKVFLMTLPLYCIVLKLRPCKLGNRNVFRCESHVPSPTYIVGELYVLLPGGASCGEGDMMANSMPTRCRVERERRRWREMVGEAELWRCLDLHLCLLAHATALGHRTSTALLSFSAGEEDAREDCKSLGGYVLSDDGFSRLRASWRAEVMVDRPLLDKRSY